MATPRENRLRELLDGAARLLEENERMAGPGFRSHSLRQQIGEIQRELDRERWQQRSSPPVEQWGRSLGSISPELVREFQETMNRIAHDQIVFGGQQIWASTEDVPPEAPPTPEVTMTGLRQILNAAYPRQLIEQELRRPSVLWDQLDALRDGWQGAPLEIPFTRTGRFNSPEPQAQELPRELRIMGCLVQPEATCSDRHVYAVPQVHPIRVNPRPAAGLFSSDRIFSEETIQSARTPGQSMAWTQEPPDRLLVDGVLSLISNLRREAGNANVNPELLCSPRTYARLQSAWTLLEGTPMVPSFTLGKESQTFEDEMDAALQAFQQDRRSA